MFALVVVAVLMVIVIVWGFQLNGSASMIVKASTPSASAVLPALHRIVKRKEYRKGDGVIGGFSSVGNIQ